MKNKFNSIASVIGDIQKGKMVIVVDDADRENEGDLIMAAQFITPAAVNFMAKHGRGLICLALQRERVKQLNLNLMSRENSLLTSRVRLARGMNFQVEDRLSLSGLTLPMPCWRMSGPVSPVRV